MSNSAVSTNFTGGRYHRAVAISKVHHFDLCSMCPYTVGPMAVEAIRALEAMGVRATDPVTNLRHHLPFVAQKRAARKAHRQAVAA